MDAPIYLDYAASTPVDRGVADVMDRVLRSPMLHANPAASGHAPGRAAQALIEDARGSVAAFIGAAPDEIVFTSGATESDNLAIVGTALFRRARGRHLVTALTEHKAVLESCRHLQSRGFRVTYLQPDRNGRIAASEIDAAIGPETILVSIMAVNNETGVVQDLPAIGAVCRARDVLLHVDAAQAAGRLPLDVRAMHIDLLSLSAHKIYGPKGVGALFVDRERVRRIEPLLHGGGQERGLRPGTLPTHQIVGLARALTLAGERMPADVARETGLRQRLWAALQAVPGVLLNGHPDHRACHILNVSVEGVEGEALFCALPNLAIASGSACTSATAEPSYVLRCLGRSAQLAQSSIRFSIGRLTSVAEIDAAAEAFVGAVTRLRRFSPAWPRVAGG